MALLHHIRYVDNAIATGVRDALVANFIENVGILDGFPDERFSVPSVAIELYRIRPMPFELGKRSKWSYIAFLNTFARSDAELDDITSTIYDYFGQQTLQTEAGDYVHFNGLSEVEVIHPRELNAVEKRRYYNVSFNGYNTYGDIGHNDIFDIQEFTIDVDVEFDTLGEFSEPIETYYYNKELDGTVYSYYDEITRYESYTNEPFLRSYLGFSQAQTHVAFLIFDTTDLLSISGINSVNLYFYMETDVSLYEGTVYTHSGQPSLPLSSITLLQCQNEISPLKFRGEGWHSLEVDSQHINTSGYSVFAFVPDTQSMTPIEIRAAEFSGTTRNYIKVSSAEHRYYDEHIILDKYTEIVPGSKAGFRLYVDEEGTLNFITGHGIYTHRLRKYYCIEPGVRNHIIATFDFTGSRIKSDLWLNGELVDSQNYINYLYLNYNNKNIYIGVKNPETEYEGRSDYANMKLYGLKLSDYAYTGYMDLVSELPNRDFGHDLLYYKVNENFREIEKFDTGDEILDFTRSSNHVTLYGGSYWTNYLTTDVAIRSVKSTATMLQFNAIGEDT